MIAAIIISKTPETPEHILRLKHPIVYVFLKFFLNIGSNFYYKKETRIVLRIAVLSCEHFRSKFTQKIENFSYVSKQSNFVVLLLLIVSANSSIMPKKHPKKTLTLTSQCHFLFVIL